jgi:hypothetical protein
VEHLSPAQEQIVREQFPQLADLRHQVHLTYWSEQHFITRDLLCRLPFGRILSTTTFYQYVDFQLPDLITAARRNFTLWALIGIRQYNRSLVDQLTLFYDDTFFWHYSIPANRSEILAQIQRGSRIRFLSRFHLSQTQIEVEFSEVRAVSDSDTEFQLVYTDSKEYTYNWLSGLWDHHIHNQEFNLLNPTIYTTPISEPHHNGREAEYQAYFETLRTHTDLILDLSYWGSLESTRVPSLTSRASTPESEYRRSRELDLQRASPALDPCLCGIDVCRCNAPRPDTPPTPPYISLWSPLEHFDPIEGLHYNRHAS